MLPKNTAFAGPSSSGETFVLFNQLPEVGIPRFSRVYLNELIAKGKFPSPVRLSERRIAWKLSDLEAWKSSRPIKTVAEHVTAGQ